MNNTLFPEIENIENTEIINPEIEDQYIPSDDEPESEYEFATGDLSSFMHDFAESKEQMGIQQKPTPEEFIEADKQVMPPSTARKTGKFIANMTDYALATGLSLISGLDADEHKADPESKKELETIITEYIKESGGEIPIWMQLVICILVTYGLQIPGAVRLRKQNKNQI